MDETGLVLALAQGDRAALEDTIRRYTHYVAAVAARALAPEPLREDLEEVVSDTFLALWRSRESLDPVRSLRPWLAVTARNLAIDRVRRRRETDAIPDHLPDSRPGPEELAERNQLHSQLRDEDRRCDRGAHRDGLHAAVHLVPLQGYPFRDQRDAGARA